MKGCNEINKKYNIIYADPPWQNTLGSKHGKKNNAHYPYMTLQEIINLPIQEITDNNCALFLWVTFPELKDGLVVMEEWGFKYKTCAFVWVKSNKRNTDPTVFDPFLGLGGWSRSNAEICLLGFKGKLTRKSAKVRQIIYSPIEAHSKKPDETRDRIIQLCGDLPRVELFARQKTDGWDAWGNEVNSDINL